MNSRKWHVLMNPYQEAQSKKIWYSVSNRLLHRQVIKSLRSGEVKTVVEKCGYLQDVLLIKHNSGRGNNITSL
jgi:hypothetical protein